MKFVLEYFISSLFWSTVPPISLGISWQNILWWYDVIPPTANQPNVWCTDINTQPYKFTFQSRPSSSLGITGHNFFKCHFKRHQKCRRTYNRKTDRQKTLFLVYMITNCSGESRISQTRAPTPKIGTPTYLFGPFLLENFIQVKKIGPRGACVPALPGSANEVLISHWSLFLLSCFLFCVSSNWVKSLH